MKYFLSLIISGALVVSGFGQTRNVLVGTNNAVVQPTNFWSADAANARSGLGLGTAATNPATAFQPSSLVLSNLASSNGVNLTNISVSGIVGALATNGNGAGLTNLTAANITGTVGLASNISGIVAITNGGTGATNAATARTNLGFTTVGNSLVTATNAEAALDVLGISTNYSNTVLSVSNLKITSFPVGSSAGFVVPDSGQNLIVRGTNTTTAVPSFFGWNGFVQTAFSAAEARTNLGLGATNAVTFGQLSLGSDLVIGDTTTTWSGNNRINYEELKLQGGNWTIDDGSLVIGGGTNLSLYQAQTRTNLGLPWSGLTNTNAATFQIALFGANTNPVLVDTNGEVVSPTNFWQAAPITTTFIESEPNTNSSTNIAAARFLHIHSLATNIVNVTNTIVLPTNGSTFVGDVALVVHQGPTNSMTRVRTAGSTNDLLTMTRFDEAVEFVYYDNVWQFNHNNSFIEPIYFSGTNAADNIAESRTNLGLGVTQTVQFNQVDAQTFFVDEGAITFSGTAAATTRTNLGFGTTNVVEFSDLTFSNQTISGSAGGGLKISYEDGTVAGVNFTFQGTNVPSYDAAGASNTRVNLGMGTTNSVTFASIASESLTIQTGTNVYIFADDSVVEIFPTVSILNDSGISFQTTNNSAASTRTNLGLGATNNVTFSNVTASGTLTATGTVTATTNLVVNGFVDFSTNHTNSNPATNNQIQKFLQIRIGTNAYFLPLYQ